MLFFRVNCVVSSEVCIEGTGGVFCVRGDHGSSSRSMVLFRATCRKLPATNRWLITHQRTVSRYQPEELQVQCPPRWGAGATYLSLAHWPQHSVWVSPRLCRHVYLFSVTNMGLRMALEEFTGFLHTRGLWVPSSEPLSASTARRKDPLLT